MNAPGVCQTGNVPSARGLLLGGEGPEGFHYRGELISATEEASLAADVRRLEFSTFEMRGVVARRRVAFFGRSYRTGGAAIAPMPGFLLPIRARVAEWAGLEADAFAMALINEYVPGAPIGWHRDAPQYDVVAGVSLLSACRMKFRPYAPPCAASGRRRTATHEILLERRSAYLITGHARYACEHHIPAVSDHRYSITFRTRGGHSSSG